ncbi:MAG: hypothetical protein JEZ08_04100 [Clostridiales bacterium]|nr:hypothetical protein [Clostridiales bacterium]
MSLLLVSCKALISDEETFKEYTGETLNFSVVGEIPLFESKMSYLQSYL